jgi:hypothetical protein
MAISPSGTSHHPEHPENSDPLVEADALKAALQDALIRSGRLLASLKQFRRQHKAVASAMASLKQFQPTP